ncbi:RluA family pseudouridine synthase [Bdellovibrionota bacterium FG-2]
MAIEKLQFEVRASEEGQRLDQVLAGYWSGVSKAKVRKLIIAGAVYLNRKRIRIASRSVQKGSRIEVFVDFKRLFEAEGPSRDRSFKLAADSILYEDESLIVVNKPPGLPTQPTLDEARDNLYALLKKFLAARDGIADAYVGLHHRLDRDTSGVVLFTKVKEANLGVSELFSEHKAVKLYQSIVLKPEHANALLQEGRGEVRNYLAKKRGAGKRARIEVVHSGGDFAHTRFRVLRAEGQGTLIEAQPLTGRTHQIRVHLAGLGLPIAGDTFYGGIGRIGEYQVPRSMLHAACLTFPHPLLNKEVSVAAPLPEDFLQCLESLNSHKR